VRFGVCRSSCQSPRHTRFRCSPRRPSRAWSPPFRCWCQSVPVVDGFRWLESTDELELRVRAALLDFEVFARLTARSRVYGSEEWVWEKAQEAAGVADAFAAVGVLAASEAEDWRRRVVRDLWETFGAERPALADEATRAAAAAHLRTLLEAVTHDRSEDPGLPSERLSFIRALETLELVGAVSKRDGVAWRDRLARRVGEPLPRPSAEERPYAAMDLCRVLAGPRGDQHRLSVTAVELYSECVIARWHLSVELSAAERALSLRERELRVAELRQELLPRFALSDDVDGAYQPVESGWPRGIGNDHWSDGETINWQSIFIPAPSVEATRLDLRDGTRREFVIPLAGGGRSRGSR
jgi:hypothetical protein